MVVDEIVGRIGDFAELGQDHLLLALEMLLVEMRRADEVGDQLRDERQIAPERAAVEHRLVARGPGVEAPADILDRFGKRARVASARALEHHMLDEMREAAEALRLGARADARVEADGDGLRAGIGSTATVRPFGRTCMLALMPSARSLQTLAHCQTIDDQRDCGEAEPLQRIGAMVVGDRR